MKKIILLLMAFSGLQAQQKLAEYTASNGITYKEGDTITMGRGSGSQGSFVYYQMGGWAAGMGDNSLPAIHSSTNVTVRKIRKAKMKGIEKVWFAVRGGNITDYNLFIEDAIATCEIKDCISEELHNPKADKFDQLKKLKELFDNGTLSEEEYQSEKKKLLDN